MFRVRIQKLGSLIGLLAILMAVLAPTVSQALASNHRLSNALATYCSVESVGDSSRHDSRSHHSAAAHWQACAYCNFLTHSPTLPGGAAPVSVTLSAAQSPVPQAAVEIRDASVHTAAQPRAPPVFS
jgi:hypothetical protein